MIKALSFCCVLGAAVAVPLSSLSKQVGDNAPATGDHAPAGHVQVGDLFGFNFTVHVEEGKYFDGHAAQARAGNCTGGCTHADIGAIFDAGMHDCTKCEGFFYPHTHCAATSDAVCSGKGVTGQIDSIDHHDATGRISLANLGFNLSHPVIFTQAPTYNGGNPCVIRVQKQTEGETVTGYKAWLAESGTRDVWHTTEKSAYVVLEKGSSEAFVVDTVDLAGSQGFQTITLSKDLGPRPWVFRMIQSTNNGADPEMSTTNRPSGLRGYVKTRMSLSENSASTFRLFLETDERDHDAAAQETIGYLAVRSGCTATQAAGDESDFSGCQTVRGEVSLGGENYDYELGVTNSVQGTKGTATVTFTKPFLSTPVVLTDLQTFRGNNPAELRTKTATTTGFSFLVEEDQSKDNDQWHMREVVAWVALAKAQ